MHSVFDRGFHSLHSFQSQHYIISDIVRLTENLFQGTQYSKEDYVCGYFSNTFRTSRTKHMRLSAENL